MTPATRSRLPAWSTTLILLGSMAALSGCVADETPPDPNVPSQPEALVTTSEGDTKPAMALTRDDTIEGPTWQVGQWFGHHVFLPTGDPAGRHYDTVIVEAADDGWLLAPNDADAAKEEAAYDLPIMGHIGSALETTGYGLEWDLYRFPLHDGKTWTADVAVRDLFDWSLYQYTTTFTVTFDPARDVLGADHPGFLITGTLDNGTTLLEYDYVPVVGWYGTFTIYKTETADPDDTHFHSISMGHGTDWTGTYYLDTAQPVAEHFHYMAPDPDFVQVNPAATFDVPEGAHLVYGFVGAFTWGGAQATVLVDPDGTTYTHHAVHAGLADPAPFGADYGYFDLPATPGTWTVATPGAGVFALGGIVLWAIWEETGTMTEGVPDAT